MFSVYIEWWKQKGSKCYQTKQQIDHTLTHLGNKSHQWPDVFNIMWQTFLWNEPDHIICIQYYVTDVLVKWTGSHQMYSTLCDRRSCEMNRITSDVFNIMWQKILWNEPDHIRCIQYYVTDILVKWTRSHQMYSTLCDRHSCEMNQITSDVFNIMWQKLLKNELNHINVFNIMWQKFLKNELDLTRCIHYYVTDILVKWTGSHQMYSILCDRRSCEREKNRVIKGLLAFSPILH